MTGVSPSKDIGQSHEFYDLYESSFKGKLEDKGEKAAIQIASINPLSVGAQLVSNVVSTVGELYQANIKGETRRYETDGAIKRTELKTNSRRDRQEIKKERDGYKERQVTKRFEIKTDGDTEINRQKSRSKIEITEAQERTQRNQHWYAHQEKMLELWIEAEKLRLEKRRIKLEEKKLKPTLQPTQPELMFTTEEGNTRQIGRLNAKVDAFVRAWDLGDKIVTLYLDPPSYKGFYAEVETKQKTCKIFKEDIKGLQSFSGNKEDLARALKDSFLTLNPTSASSYTIAISPRGRGGGKDPELKDIVEGIAIFVTFVGMSKVVGLVFEKYFRSLKMGVQADVIAPKEKEMEIDPSDSKTRQEKAEVNQTNSQVVEQEVISPATEPDVPKKAEVKEGLNRLETTTTSSRIRYFETTPTEREQAARQHREGFVGKGNVLGGELAKALPADAVKARWVSKEDEQS